MIPFINSFSINPLKVSDSRLRAVSRINRKIREARKKRLPYSVFIRSRRIGTIHRSYRFQVNKCRVGCCGVQFYDKFLDAWMTVLDFEEIVDSNFEVLCIGPNDLPYPEICFSNSLGSICSLPEGILSGIN